MCARSVQKLELWNSAIESNPTTVKLWGNAEVYDWYTLLDDSRTATAVSAEKFMETMRLAAALSRIPSTNCRDL
jgi:hypothetical protein